jgi:hypothetical protein
MWQASKKASKKNANKIQVRVRKDRKAETGDTRMYSRSSFLLRGRSTLERCGNTESTNATKATLFSDEQAMEANSFPLSGGIGGTDRNPYTEVGAQLHNSIGGSQQENHKAFTWRKLWGDLSCPRKVPRRRSEANTNHFGRIVDLGLLSQSTKSWGIWLAREGDLQSWSSALMEKRECGQGNLDLR